MKRNSFVYMFRAFQIMIMATFTMSLFWRTNMNHRSVNDGMVYMGALFFALMSMMFNGFSELAMTIDKLPVYFKQRDYLFYPAWAYALPTWILNIPFSCIEVAIWVSITYYAIGFDSSEGRMFKHYLLLFLVNQMASGLFRLLAVIGRILVIANVLAAYTLLVVMVMGGFIVSYGEVKKWWLWGYWASPIMYSQNAISANEFLGKKWSHILPGSNETLGARILKARDISPDTNWFWIGVGALIGYVILFNILFIIALRYLKPPGVLTALMGVSGAGKTTLMDVLAGRKTHVTVYESLTFSAWLRLPPVRCFYQPCKATIACDGH